MHWEQFMQFSNQYNEEFNSAVDIPAMYVNLPRQETSEKFLRWMFQISTWLILWSA